MNKNLNKTKFDIAYGWVRHSHNLVISLEHDTDYIIERLAAINHVLSINPMARAAEQIFYDNRKLRRISNRADGGLTLRNADEGLQSSRSIGYGINEDASWSEVAPDAWGMEGQS